MKNTKINLEKVLEKIIIYISYLIVLIPLVVVPKSYFPYIIQKTIIFRILIEIILAAFVVLLFTSDKYRPKKSLIAWSMLAYAVVMVITTLTSQGLFRSWWGNWERMFGTFTYLHIFAWFFILISLFKKTHYWIKILNLSLATSLLISLYSITQRLGSEFTLQSGLERVSGTIGNASFLASYLIIHLFVGLLFLSEVKSKKWKLYYLATILINLFVLILTGTRGAILALAVAIVIFIPLVFWLKIYKQKTVKYLLIFSLFMVLIGGILLAFKNTDFIQNNYWLKRLTNYSLSDNTVQTRLRSWSWGLKGFGDNFIFGSGPENYQISFNKYFEPDFYDYSGSEIWFDRAHNNIIDIATTMGIFGLVSYLGIFVAVFLLLYKLHKSKTLSSVNFCIILLLFITYFLQNSFVFDSLNSLIPFTLILAYVHFIYTKNQSVENSPEKSKKWLQYIVLPLSFGGFLLILLLVNIPEVKANKYVYQAYVDKAYGRYDNAAEDYKTAYRITVNKDDAAVLFANYLNEIISKKIVSDKENQISDLLLSINWLEEAIKNEPKSMFLYYVQAKNYALVAELTQDVKYIKKGIDYALEARQLSPGRVRPLWLLGQLYLYGSQPQKAIEYIEQAIELNPKQADSYYFLAIIYKSQGNIEKYYEMYDKMIAYNYNFLDKAQIVDVISHYDNLGDTKSLIYLFNSLVKLESNSVNNWQNLINLYIKEAQYNQARETLKRAINIIPEISEQAELMYKKIDDLEKNNLDSKN